MKNLSGVHWYKTYGWAAAILFILLTAAWLITYRDIYHQSIVVTNAAQAKQEVMPGREGALLTLSDGSVLTLDSMNTGVVVTQKGAKIQLQEGQLVYGANIGKQNSRVYNTLLAPNGREFKIVLPDGTRAWLNSSSSIRYPVQFDTRQRIVYVTGEVYFEVASLRSQHSNSKIPFLVKINTPAGDGGTVEVLGTHFNINAYEPEAKTTLLEGSVKVHIERKSQSNKNEVILKPGQQAKVLANSNDVKTITADVDKVMAWRRGFFNFDGVGLAEVMQQLARWYDIQIEYEAGVPSMTFGGELSRSMKLSGVLKALEESGVHLKLEDRKITVLK